MRIHHPASSPSVTVLFSAFAVVALLAATPFVAGDSLAVDNKSELQCQLGTAQGVGKFIREKGQCIDNCQKKAFADGMAPDCSPPYTGATAGCVTSAEGKAGGALQSACALDCPECYAGGDCPADAPVRVADAEAHVDALAAEVFCDDSASPDALTLSEFKCQRTVRKVITHFAATKLKCYAKCRKGEIAGKVSAGDCTPPAADPKTADCISKAELKTAFLIDKKCESSVNPSADKPECAPYDTRVGADWVAAEEAVVDAMLPGLFCNDTTTTTTTMP